MAFQQRLSPRFFAAFYNWNRLTQHHTCPRILRYRRSDLQYLTRAGGSRTLVASSQYRQTETPLVQEQNDSKQDHLGIYTEILEDEQVARPRDEARELRVEELEARSREASIGEELDLGSKSIETDGVTSGSTAETRSSGDEIGESVRALMRNVAHPVAIITAAHREPDIDGPAPLGMAVSSFNTVTLKPPTISFNVRQPSRTLDAIRADNGRLRVHIMVATREGAVAASLFAGSNSAEAFHERLETAPFLLSDPGSDTPQRLDPSEVFALDCELSAELDVEDHKIIVARVTRATTSTYSSPSLQYIQGTYRSGVGPAVLDQKGTSIGDEEFFRIVPFVIRESNRRMFAKRLEDYVKKHPELRDMSLKEAERIVRDHFPTSIGVLGVSVRQIIARTLDHRGLPEYEKDEPVFYDFYEQVSPEDMKTMASRIQRLVQQDPDFIALDNTTLLELVSCYKYAEIIPSQLLNPLRKEGLLGKFEPLPDDHVISPNDTPTLQMLEQVEYRLRKHIRTKVPAAGPPLDPIQLVKAVGAPEHLRRFVRGLQWKLRVEEHPSFHVNKSIDIAGQLDEHEARVVVYRVFSHMRVRPSLYVNGNPTTRPELILRDCRVHPFIGGALTAKTMFMKIAKLGSRAQSPSSFLFTIRKEVEKLFDANGTPTYSALQQKIHALVDKDPLRAVRWSEKDIAVWAGVLPSSRILRDEQSGASTMLLRPGIVHNMVKQALRAKYPEEGMEPDPLIAAFIQGSNSNGTVGLRIKPRRVYLGSPEAKPPSKLEQHYARLKSMIPAEATGQTIPEQGKSHDQESANPSALQKVPEIRKRRSPRVKVFKFQPEGQKPEEAVQEKETPSETPPARRFGWQAYGMDGKRVME